MSARRPAPAAFPDAVIVLAGGRGRRLGGVDKAALVIGHRTLLAQALAAAAGARVVVVGPVAPPAAGVLVTMEDPPGGGPAAGVAAGLAALRGDRAVRGDRADRAGPALDPSGLVAILAVDQPGVDAATLARLAAAIPPDRARGAVLAHEGRRQYAVGVFPVEVLAAAVGRRPSWHGAPLRALIDPLVGAEVPAERAEAADVDTPADLARWRMRTGDDAPEAGGDAPDAGGDAPRTGPAPG